MSFGMDTIKTIKNSADMILYLIALIYGYSIRSSVGMSNIRRLIGVCPQVSFDDFSQSACVILTVISGSFRKHVLIVFRVYSACTV